MDNGAWGDVPWLAITGRKERSENTKIREFFIVMKTIFFPSIS